MLDWNFAFIDLHAEAHTYGCIRTKATAVLSWLGDGVFINARRVESGSKKKTSSHLFAVSPRSPKCYDPEDNNEGREKISLFSRSSFL